MVAIISWYQTLRFLAGASMFVIYLGSGAQKGTKDPRCHPDAHELERVTVPLILHYTLDGIAQVK